MQEFSRMAKAYGICEATSDKVSNNADNSAYDQVIDNLKTTENARVVICFCEGMTVKGLLKAAKRRHVQGHFLFIGRSVNPPTIYHMNIMPDNTCYKINELDLPCGVVL